jgi:hypothetical protein
MEHLWKLSSNGVYTSPALQRMLERKCLRKLYIYMPKARMRIVERRRKGRANEKDVQEEEIGITEKVERREQNTA